MSVSTDAISRYLKGSIGALQAVLADEAVVAGAAQVVELCVAALARGNKIMLAGNGGSAADAQHWAGELVCRFKFDRPGLAAIALTLDAPCLTAVANDIGYEFIFSRQVEALGREGDVFFAISTSGRSPNILAAVEACTRRGITTVAFTGGLGGALKERADLTLCIPSPVTSHIQEGHEALGHIICDLIEQRMFPKE